MEKNRYVVCLYLGNSLNQPLTPLSKIINNRTDNVILKHGTRMKKYTGRPGHSTSFRDKNNQWWIMYHAVQESNPYLRDIENIESIVPQERLHSAVMLQKLKNVQEILIPEGGSLTKPAEPYIQNQEYPSFNALI